MKTKEELNELKIEYESLSRKLAELTDDELEQVTGGVILPGIGTPFYYKNGSATLKTQWGYNTTAR